MRRTPKALAALIAVVALLTITASPSAAETSAVTGGTKSINLVPPVSFSLSGPCSSTSFGTFTTSLTSATWTFNIVQTFVYSGGNYILTMTGTVHVSSAHITTGTNGSKYLMDFDGSTPSSNILITDVMIYTASSATDCDPAGGTPKCGDINESIPHFYGLLTTSTGTTVTHNTTTSRHAIPVSSTIVFSGSTTFSPPSNIVANIAAAGCTPPFSALNGKMETFSGLTSHVTSGTP